MAVRHLGTAVPTLPPINIPQIVQATDVCVTPKLIPNKNQSYFKIGYDSCEQSTSLIPAVTHRPGQIQPGQQV